MYIFLFFLKLYYTFDENIFEDINNLVIKCLTYSEKRYRQNKCFSRIYHPLLKPIRLTNSSAVFHYIPTNQVIKRIVKKGNNGRCEEKLCLLFDHPNILKTYETYELFDKKRNEKVFFLISEYLEEKINRETISKDETIIKNIMHDVLEGLKYIHKLGYAHLDLKIDNIMSTKVNGKSIYKIIDFGFTRKCDDGEIKLDNIYYGTFPYSPPEIYFDSIYCKKADIWCLGMIAFILISDKNSFNTSSGSRDYEKYENFIVNRDEKAIENVSLEMKIFINGCLCIQYENRPTVEEILKYKLFLN